MSPIFKLTLFVLSGTILYTLLKQYAPQLSFAFSLAVCACVLLFVFDIGADIIVWLLKLSQNLEGETFLCLLRASGIALCTDWCINLCNADCDSDCGYIM